MTSKYDDLARAALAEVTATHHVGDWVEDRVREDAPGVVDVVYASAQDGYRGWSWVVSVAEVEGEAPTVLELGLLPGEGALLAPEWVPWSVRLAEWEAQQAAEKAEAAAVAEAEGADPEPENEDAADDEDGPDEDEDDESDEAEDGDSADEDDDLDEDDDIDSLDDDDDDDLDDDEEEDDDLDEVGPRTTHGGDIDGVDIDDLDAP